MSSAADPGPALPRFQYTGSIRDDAVYVERPADRELIAKLLRGDYCHVLATRQIGKSSLRARTAKALARAGVRCASIDLTAIGTTSDAGQWYLGLVDQVAAKLRLEEPFAFWAANAQFPPAQRWTRYLRRVMLPAIAAPIVILIDEIESVRLVSFETQDFFLSVRELYEARAEDAEMKRLTFCMLGAASPSDLITNKAVTPFSISELIRLEDFRREELEVLASSLAHAGADAARVLDEVHAWTDGHPYMTMRLLAELSLAQVARGQEKQRVSEVVTRVFFDNPLTDPNLGYAFARFDQEDLLAPVADKVALYRQVLAGLSVSEDVNNAAQLELQLAGMVKLVRCGAGAAQIRVRNAIFGRVFDRDWLRTKETERFLSESVSHWIDSKKGRDALLRGSALTRATEMSKTGSLTRDEEEFLRASLEEAQRSARARLIVIVLIAALVVGLALAAMFAMQSRQDLAGKREELAQTTAQLDLVKDRRDALEREKKDLEEQIAKLRKAADDAQNRVEVAEQSIKVQEGQRSALQKEYDRLSGEKELELKHQTERIKDLTAQATNDLNALRDSLAKAQDDAHQAKRLLFYMEAQARAYNVGLELPMARALIACKVPFRPELVASSKTLADYLKKAQVPRSQDDTASCVTRYTDNKTDSYERLQKAILEEIAKVKSPDDPPERKKP